MGLTSKPISVPKQNCLLLLIIFIVDQCVCRSPSSLCWANHVFHTRSLVQQPTQTWNRAKDSLSCAKRGPKRLSNYHLSFDKVARLHNPLVFPLLVVVCPCGHFLPFWEHCYQYYSFLHNVFLCLWRRRAFEFRNERKEGSMGRVRKSSVGSPESEWQRERVRERTREMLSVCQRKQFPWFGCQWSSETMRLPSEKTAPMISLFLSLSLSPSHSRSRSPRLNWLLSDWTLRFFLQQLTWPNPVWWLKYSGVSDWPNYTQLKISNTNVLVFI